jgi:glycerol-1-phosphate dehydrogenase [NAD(P)+]
VSVARPPSAPEIARDLDALRAHLAASDEAARLQPLGLGGVLLGSGVLDSVGEIVDQLRAGREGDVVLIADRRPMATRAGEVKASVVEQVSGTGATIRRVDVGDEHAETHADGPTIDAAAGAAAGASVLVSVGSGTVTDIGKALSVRLGGVPHLIVQTAASVNGFADDQSVLLVDGVKRTTATSWADRLVIDTDVIARAPVELNLAGLGDLMATYTAPADWALARFVGQDDSYSQAAVALARAHIDTVLSLADGIATGEPDAIENLSAALTLSGISMGVAGRTAPASGMEHTVSHLIEMAERPGEPSALHGAKVGALSVLAAMLWERVRALARDGALRSLRFPEPAEMRPRVLDAFAALDPTGSMGEECWRGYSAKLERWRASRDSLSGLAGRWEGFESMLDGLLATPQRLTDALNAAGAPLRLSQLGIDKPTLTWALANGHLMRDRFSIADLAFFLGAWERPDVEQLLSDAARLGAGA